MNACLVAWLLAWMLGRSRRTASPTHFVLELHAGPLPASASAKEESEACKTWKHVPFRDLAPSTHLDPSRRKRSGLR